MCGRSSTFRKRVSFYGATPPAFVFGKDRFARAANACLFRSGPAQNVGGIAPGNKSQLPEGRRPSAHQAAEPRKHRLEKLCRNLSLTVCATPFAIPISFIIADPIQELLSQEVY